MSEASRVLGPYRLDRQLGRGGMGEVWKARDRRLDRWVAIKRVRADVSEDETARERFRREARTVAHLSHPSIVQIFDLVEEDDGDWVVMEYVDGPTVAEQLAEGPLDVGVAVEYGRQVAEGLAEAHDKGVVHRDLKTENVIVAAPARGREPGRVKILDFGLAKRLIKQEGESTLSVRGAVMGTGRAMSPEQAQGYPVDHRSDLFSLGVFLYEMLAGSSPFRGESLLETLNKICSLQPPPIAEERPDVPADLSRLVDRLLAKDPAWRPPSARDVAAELGRVARRLSGDEAEETPDTAALDQPTIVPSPPAPADSEPARAGSRRGWPRLAVAALVLLLATSAVAVFVARLHPEAPAGEVSTPEERHPARPHALYQQGMDLLGRFDLSGNIDRSIAVFQRALALDASYAPALAGLARAYWYKYRFDSKDPQRLQQALAAAEQAVEHEPYLAVARVSRGLAYSYLGRYDDAQADFEEALRLEPGNAAAFCGMGELQEFRGDLEGAETSYRRAVELDPGNRELYDHLGTLYYKTGRYEAAEEAFKNSVEAAPDGILGYRNLSAVYYMQGRYDEAASQLQQALRIQKDGTLYSNLGTLLFIQGLYQQAAAAFEKALEQPAGGHDFLLWGNLGDAYRWTAGGEEKAREAYRRAIQLLAGQLELKPQSIDLRTQTALFRAKLGDCDRALAGAEELAAVGGRDAQALYLAALTYEICGAREEALDDLERALDEGFSQAEVRSDPELFNLREDPRYHRLMLRYGSLES